MNARHLRNAHPSALALGLVLTLCAGTVQPEVNVAQRPLYLGGTAAPLNMLVLGRDHTLYYEAYNDASDLDGDGVLDVGYKPSRIDYTGYFDSYKCYDYDAGNGRFNPRPGRTPNKQCSGAWSGDFLNYLTTARIDALRKVLYGGRRLVDSDGLVVLERSYIPQDAHSWGKEYTSPAVDGYDLRNYAPLPLPEEGTRHLFVNTTLLKTGNKEPLLRVLTNSAYRMWQWVAIERPVAGTYCVNGSSTANPCATTEKVSCAITSGLNLTQTVYTLSKATRDQGINTPAGEAQFNALERQDAKATQLCGSRPVTEVNGSGNPFTSTKGCASTYYLTIFEGTIQVPSAGTYQFALDGAQTLDLSIDGSLVVGRYGNNSRCGDDACRCGSSVGARYLTAGTHFVKLRQVTNNVTGYYYLRTRKVTPAAVLTDYVVRVKVCDPAAGLEANCRAYPAGTVKPAGLLQRHGEGEQMFFGLISGSYLHPYNMRGGVLRKNMGSIRDEVDPSTGAFTATTGIIGTLDRLRIVDFQMDQNYFYQGGWVTTRSMATSNNRFPDWGNPIGELLYEAVRYFAGKPGPTAAFLPATGTSEVVPLRDYAPGAANSMSLPLAAWRDPFGAGAQDLPTCSAGALLVISDLNPTFDTEYLPGSSFSSFTGDLPGLNVTNEANAIWTAEHGSAARWHFIGQVGSNTDGAPTAKLVSGLGNIRGLAPNDPTKQGGYYSAAVAKYAFETDLRPEIAGRQNLNTVVVALASPLPKIDIPVGGTRINVVPFAKSVGGASITAGRGDFQPTNTIVDFFVSAFANTDPAGSDRNPDINEGRPYIQFRINFEDVEQGADHDMDAIALYEFSVNADNTLTVQMTSEYAGGGIIQHMGYVISGTTRDGVYLEVRDKDTAEANDIPYFLNTPPGLLPGACDTVSPPPACQAALPLTANRTFLPGSGGGATVLNSPLWYAAKYGTRGSERLREGETSANYFLVTNATRLDQQLEGAFNQILGLTSSSSAMAATSTQLQEDTLIYQARFDSGNWTGEVRALALDAQGHPGNVLWSTNTTGLIPAAARRNVVTYNGETGLDFLRAEIDRLSLAQCAGLLDMTPAALVQAAALENCDPAALPGEQTDCRCGRVKPRVDLSPAIARLDWLRGDSSGEQPDGNLRQRAGPLGDIINSNPLLVGIRDGGFDALTGRGPETQYQAFLAGLRAAGRPPVLYVGANDALLHAFHGLTGAELFAYQPLGVGERLAALTKPQYLDDHLYTVDGSPSVSDAWIEVAPRNFAWRTVLIGALGAGGRSVFALDVTDPVHFSSDDVLWEFLDPELGVTLGRPTIVRLAAGWMALFGNGVNSASGRAQLFVVDLSSGRLVRRLDTGVGSGAAPNGLFSPLPVDLDEDRITDRVYAGDLQGNLWRFDLSDPTPANWDLAFAGRPLFSARDAQGQPQPITSRPAALRHPHGGLLLLFGTGKFFSDGDEIVRSSTQVQTFYGVRDAGAPVAGRAALQPQTILFQGRSSDRAIREDLRVISAEPVDYRTQAGWYLDLIYGNTREGERVVDAPLLRRDRVIFTSIIPPADACAAGGETWVTALDAVTGGRLPYSAFDFNNDGDFSMADFVTISLIQPGVSGGRQDLLVPASAFKATGINEGTLITDPTSGRDYLYLNNEANGAPRIMPGTEPSQQSWRQLR